MRLDRYEGLDVLALSTSDLHELKSYASRGNSGSIWTPRWVDGDEHRLSVQHWVERPSNVEVRTPGQLSVGLCAADIGILLDGGELQLRDDLLIQPEGDELHSARSDS